jgi:hypothetical protein
MADPKVTAAAVKVNPSENQKIKRSDGTIVERASKEYEQKHPPIYVTDPKNSMIGYFNEAGNQYLLKEKEKKREDIKSITSGLERAKAKAFATSEEELKPMTRTPIIKEALRKIVNPDFRDSDYTEKHNSVVDALGNPKYKYYNKDKVIGESKYKKLKDEQGK